MTVYGFVFITASVTSRLVRPIYWSYAWAQACDLWSITTDSAKANN